jgi:hypothetical protein
MKLIIAFRNFANAPKKKMEEESHKCHVTVTVSSAFSPLSRTVPATTTIGWRMEIDSRQAASFFCFAVRPNRIWGSHEKYQDPLSPKMEHPVAQLDEALNYKPEGRGFDSR